jgi:branched-chain amino acid transport system permease protein
MDYVFHLVVLIGVYVMLATSLDLLAGHTGILSLSHAAFFGIGGYCSAILTLNFGIPTVLGALAGMVLSAFISFMVSLPSMRLKEDYFVLSTFGFQLIAFDVLNNWQGLTGGPSGIVGIPGVSLLGYRVESRLSFATLTVFLATVVICVCHRIARSPFGRVLHAIREDEVFAESLGKNTFSFKTQVFAISAAVAALAGSLYAHYITFIDPTSFTVMESILIVSMVIIGGAGSRWGPITGAAMLVLLPEALRFIGLPATAAAHVRQILYGSLFVVLLMVRPQGLAGQEPVQR